MRKHSLESVVSFFNELGLSVNPPILHYKDSKTYLQFICKKENHTFLSNFNRLRRSRSCPRCSETDRAAPRRLDINIVREYVSGKGGILLDTTYKNCMSKLNVLCKNGHKFSISKNAMRNHWCGHCSKKHKWTIEDCKKFAKNKGGKCLSDSYSPSQSRLIWQCNKGHIWEAVRASVMGKTNRWCHLCSKGRNISDAETELFTFVKSKYPTAISNIKGILNNKLFELDIYVPELKKAIEYDGDRWHSFPEAVDRDDRKNKDCKVSGISLMRVSHSRYKKWPNLIKQEVLAFLGQQI